ncbi:hypothetical protein ABVT39_019881 [Epinephelus coioides]
MAGKNARALAAAQQLRPGSQQETTATSVSTPPNGSTLPQAGPQDLGVEALKLELLASLRHTLRRFLKLNSELHWAMVCLQLELTYNQPPKTRRVSFLRSAPWYTSELREMKKAGRVLERRFIASRLTMHKQAYKEHQKAYAKSLRDARSQFYSNIISNSPSNSKKLFSTINSTLHLLKPQAQAPPF